MRILLLALLASAEGARVAGEPPTRTVLPQGEGCRSASELTTVMAELRPAVEACLGGTGTRAPLLLDVDTAGAARVRIGEPPLDGCLAGVTSRMSASTCLLAMEWPIWADPRGLSAQAPPPGALADDAAILEMGKAVIAAGSPAVHRCAEQTGAVKGAWQVELAVEVDGHVRSAAVSRVEGANASFEACLLGIVRDWRFLPVAREQRWKKTFRFEAG